MKKKLMIISAAAVLALGGLATIAGAIGSGHMSITKAATAHADHDHSAMVEKAFQAPTTSAEGYKPFYLCSECCASDFRASRYSVADKDENLADVVIPALTAATTADIASGDGISAINTKKFKYVDQGANKGEASSDKVESTPLFVKDSGKTAIYFSRSGMAATPNNPTGNDGCSEFRFTVPTEAAKSKSVSFSYKYMNWGTGSWAGGTSASEPAGWTALIQFKDSGSYIGHDVSAKLTNDGEWHTLKLDYSGGTTASLTDFIFKFTDLRGYIMVSGLTYEATKDVTLKNVNADGTDGTANVLVGSLPDSPTMDGKTFLGWYDESGNKVESVTASTTTLVARWTCTYYDDSNSKILTFSDKQSDYTTPEGVDAAYTVQTDDQVKNNSYLTEVPDGLRGFASSSDEAETNGIGLPAFDFSKVSGVRFVFGFHAGVWVNGDLNAKGAYLNGKYVGPNTNGHRYQNFVVDIKGKAVTVLNQDTSTTYEITLSEDIYTGKKGLEITVDRNWGAYLFISPYMSYDCDYLSVMSSIEAALPDTPAAGYTDQINKVKTLSGYMTAYEKANLLTPKMQNWIKAYTATKVLAFDDHGDSVYANLTGNSSFSAATYVNKYDSNGWKDESRTDSLQFQILGLDCTYFTLTLPAFNFSSYSKVSFTMELGGGNGDKTVKYWLGAIPDTANTATASPTADLMSASNYIGIAPTGTAWNWDTGGTTVTISDGKITFSGLSNSAEGKTFNLDDSINNGTTGLSITVGWGSWNSFAISPFYASQF